MSAGFLVADTIWNPASSAQEVRRMDECICMRPFDWSVWFLAMVGWVVTVKWLWRLGKSAWKKP